MDSQIETVGETPASSGDAISYCGAEICVGFPLKVDTQETVEESECPVCYESFTSRKVVWLKNCNHVFCEKCISDLDIRDGCPMCRKKSDEMLTLSRQVCKTEHWEAVMENHKRCIFNSLNSVKEYFEELTEEWIKLIEFICKTQSSSTKYIGISGIEHLSFEKYKEEGRLLKKGSCYAVIKNKQTQIVIGCFLPNMSLRLVISPNDDTDFGQDNEYADEAVGYMNKQLEVCWRVFPRLFKYVIDRIFVRKFKTTTCFLLLNGFHDAGELEYHYVPMAQQLQSLKKCNFDSAFYKQVRNSFPPLNKEELVVTLAYHEYDCCKRHKESNDDDED